MGEWKNIIFKEIAKVQGGFAFKSDYYTDEGNLLVRIGNLHNGKISKQNSVYIKNEFKTYEEFILKESDILMGLTGDLGKIAIICREDLPALLNQRVGRFLPKIEVDLNYIYHLISSQYFIEKLKVFFEGGAQANISPKQIEAVKVIVPESKPEQTRIAEILSTSDEAIAHTEALIAKYQRIKTGLMQDLLTKGIDDKGNIRSKETHKFVVKNGIEVPEEWDIYTIGEIVEQIGSGITPKGGSNVYIHSGVMLIRSQNVLKGEFDFSDVAFISDEINSRMKRSELRDLDVLLNITGASIGRSHYLPIGFQKANVNQHVCIIRLIEKSLGKSLFLSTFLNDFKGQNQIKRLLGSSNREGLNFQQIREIKVGMPRIETDDEFERIRKVFGSHNNSIRVFKLNLAKLHSLKSGLMQDLLSGKVRVHIDNKN